MWGWAIGSGAGALMFPEQVEGPRLQDLKVQTSEYGRPIPIVYGHVGIGGNVIWAMDLIEVEGSSGGGKGGAEQTTYSYFANFAVAVCEGEAAFGRIWAGPEKRLIWDGTLLEGTGNITFYTGTETQEPDPLMESDLGVGNVPAYRGTAYVVFEMFPLEKDGNRIPFLTFEVGNVATNVNTGPANTGFTWFSYVLQADELVFSFYYGTYDGVTIHQATTDPAQPMTFYRHYGQHLGPIGSFENRPFLDPDRRRIVVASLPSSGLGFTTQDWDNGDIDEIAFTLPIGADPNIGVNILGGCYHNGSYIFLSSGSSGSPTGTIGFCIVDPDTLECTAAYSGTTGASSGPDELLQPADPSANYLLVVSSDLTLTKHTIASGLPATTIGTVLGGTVYGGSLAVDPYTGYVWSHTYTGGTLSWTVHDPVTATLVNSGSVPASFYVGTGGFAFEPSNVIVFGTRYLAVDYFVLFDHSGNYLSDAIGGYHGTASLMRVVYNDTANQLIGFRYGGNINFAPENDPLDLHLLDPITGEHAATTLYHANPDVHGSVDLGSADLDNVVRNLCIRAGLDAGQIDVTALADDKVDGFVVGNVTTVKDAILALSPAYYFDGAEWDGKMHFPKRGGTPVVVIPDADLGASESSGEQEEPLMTVRKMDDDLPLIVTVKYLSQATKYEVATRAAQRLVGESQNRQAPLDMPIVMTDTKAQEVAEVNLHLPWVSRLSYTFSLPRKYSYLTPTDVIVVGGYTVRLLRIQKTADGRLKCEAVHDDAHVYTPEVIVTETPPPEEEVGVTSVTTLELM
jgi:hypothetical protein